MVESFFISKTINNYRKMQKYFHINIIFNNILKLLRADGIRATKIIIANVSFNVTRK